MCILRRFVPKYMNVSVSGWTLIEVPTRSKAVEQARGWVATKMGLVDMVEKVLLTVRAVFQDSTANSRIEYLQVKMYWANMKRSDRSMNIQNSPSAVKREQSQFFGRRRVNKTWRTRDQTLC